MNNKFNFEQKVVYKGKEWYIIGIMLKCGYDCRLWEYRLGIGTYGDWNPLSGYARTDFDMKDCIPEDMITCMEKWAEQVKAANQKKIAELQAEIDKLTKETNVKP